MQIIITSLVKNQWEASSWFTSAVNTKRELAFRANDKAAHSALFPLIALWGNDTKGAVGSWAISHLRDVQKSLLKKLFIIFLEALVS
jgi:hypothetical protein